MGHTGASDSFNESFLDDTVFDIESQFACALLRSAPAHAVGETGNFVDFFNVSPAAFLRNGSGRILRPFGHADHLLDFMSKLHFQSLFLCV